MDLSHIVPTYHKYFTFELKDFDKTRDKVKSYTPRGKDYKDLAENVWSILDYWVDIFTITQATKRDIYFRHCIQNSSIETPRALAKSCHTAVNALAFQYHIVQFQALDLTYSQATECAKRFYIENYSAINEKLAELLEETLQQTPLASIYFVD